MASKATVRTCSPKCRAQLREQETPTKGSPREYPQEIVEQAISLYSSGSTVREVQKALPIGFKAQRILERHLTERRPLGKRDQAGPKNHAWKGDGLGYEAAHWRVKALKGSASGHRCLDCQERAMDWSYNGGCAREAIDPQNGCAYSPNPEMYSPRCRSCHRQYDAAMRESGMANV